MKAILTGHTRGLGAAIACTLLARGIPVLALARHEAPALTMKFPALITQVSLDLADSVALQRWLESGTLARFVAGSEAVLLINNAGTLGPVGLLGQHDPAGIAAAISLNLAAPLILADALRRTYAGEVRICHLSSGAAREAYVGWSLYGATKAALDHHARAVAREGAPNLRICSLAPGVVDTGMQAEVRGTPADRFPALARFMTLHQEGKLTAPAEAAHKLVDYLLSEAFGTEPVADLRRLPTAP